MKNKGMDEDLKTFLFRGGTILTLAAAIVGLYYTISIAAGHFNSISYHTCLSSTVDPKFCWENIYQGDPSSHSYAHCDMVEVVSSTKQ